MTSAPSNLGAPRVPGRGICSFARLAIIVCITSIWSIAGGVGVQAPPGAPAGAGVPAGVGEMGVEEAEVRLLILAVVW